MTSKQRAYLRSLANTLDPIFQIGKGGINDNMLDQIDAALEKRELIKVTLLQTAEEETREACDLMCSRLGAEPVQCIGRRFVIYRRSQDDPQIELPR